MEKKGKIGGGIGRRESMGTGGKEKGMGKGTEGKETGEDKGARRKYPDEEKVGGSGKTENNKKDS